MAKDRNQRRKVHQPVPDKNVVFTMEFTVRVTPLDPADEIEVFERAAGWFVLPSGALHLSFGTGHDIVFAVGTWKYAEVVITVKDGKPTTIVAGPRG